MSKPIYKEKYKEYLRYCKEHGYSPYKLNSLIKMTYTIPGSWNLNPREKVELWYKKELFKKRLNNGMYKWLKEKEYYDNYEGEKIKYYPYINAIRQGIPKEEAIKRKVGSKSKYYRDNIDKAKVSYYTFIARINGGIDWEEAITTPKRKPGRQNVKMKMWENNKKKTGNKMYNN